MGKTVPWSSWEEWTKVKTWLFADDANDIVRGVARVSSCKDKTSSQQRAQLQAEQRLLHGLARQVATWRLRGRVPLGAEITATLLEAMQHDPKFLPGSTPDSVLALADNMLQHQYSLALVR